MDPLASIRSTSGTAKAIVLPDPVGDLTSTSRPGQCVREDHALDRKRGGDAALREGVDHRA